MTSPHREDMLSTQLLRRGFLVETEGDTIFLTDNAFLRSNSKRPETVFLEKKIIPEAFVSTGANKPFWEPRMNDERPLADQEVLTALLNRMDLGYIVKTNTQTRPYRLIVPDHPLTAEQRCVLFEWPIIRSECFHNDKEATLRWFKKKVPTPKIPLCLLESHVALLVKAFSAVGCGIWYSCEGHVNVRHVRCEFMGPIHAFWANYLLEDAAKVGLTGFLIQRKLRYFRLVSSTLPQRPETQSSLELSQLNAIALGVHVYRNRFRLREERVNWVKRYERQQME